MDCKGIEGDGPRTKSFRHESYNNRRVFLRSYPLQLGEQDEYNKEDPLQLGEQDEYNKEDPFQLGEQDGYNKEDMVGVADGSNQKKPMKKIILSVFHWGGEKFLLLRRVKHKFTVHIIACIPIGLKTPTALTSA